MFCLCACLCTVCTLSVHGGQKRESSPQELELQTIEGGLWMLGIESRSPEEQPVLLMAESSL